MLGILVIVFSLLFLLLFLSGPRLSLEIHFAQKVLPDDLDSFLIESEASFGDVIEGAEKTILWANSELKQKTEYAVVYLHGFGAAHLETRPLGDDVAKGLGANLYYTRLRGHGRTSEAFSESRASEWMEDALEALEIGRRLGEKVVLMGCSTGGALATWLCDFENGKDIEALVLVSPNFGPKDKRSLFLDFPWARKWLPLILGRTYRWSTPNDTVMKYWVTSHRTEVLFEMMALVKHVKALALSEMRVPLIAFYSEEDLVVDSQKTKTVFEQFGSLRKELVEVEENSDPLKHLIVGNIWSPENNRWIADKCLHFLKSYSS